MKMTNETPYVNRILFSLVIFLAVFSLVEGSEKTTGLTDFYAKTEALIPMRDGVHLYTEIYTPNDTATALPIIFARTPYGVSKPEGEYSIYIPKLFKDLAEDRFIFAIQDARGRYKSKGKFVWNRPIRDSSDPLAIDASTDTYDSIDWLVKNLSLVRKIRG